MDINSLQELRVVELKKELEIRGLSKSGSKKELVDRLKNVSVCVTTERLRPFSERSRFVFQPVYLQMPLIIGIIFLFSRV